MINIKYISR